MDDILLSTLRWDDVKHLIEQSVFRAIQTHRQSLESDQFISIKNACQILSVTPPTIYDYIERGKLKKYKIDSTTRLLKSEVLSIAHQQ